MRRDLLMSENIKNNLLLHHQYKLILTQKERFICGVKYIWYRKTSFPLFINIKHTQVICVCVCETYISQENT